MFGDHNPFPFSSSASSLLLLLSASRPSSFLLLASFTASISARYLKYRLRCISTTSASFSAANVKCKVKVGVGIFAFYDNGVVASFTAFSPRPLLAVASA